ncbi:TPA: phosphodiester glycosidase family protein [Bacillus cereus]|nr:phosphodiester glycosidase family protein [Bacillus cereus]
MKYLKKFILKFFILFIVFTFILCFLLFGTQYGHDFRLTIAESILTSQHPQYAKYTFLNTEELKELSEHVIHPKWMNSYTDSDKNLLNYNFTKLKDSPLNINIETIESNSNSKFPFKGKLVTINNPFNVKLVSHQGSQGEGKGEKISIMAKRNHAVVAINASGFNDETGTGGGNLATGIVIENGKVINSNHEVSEPALVAGLTKFGQLITGNYTTKELINMQVISAAGFMPQLIVNGEKMITEGDGGWGSGPRSIMAQKKDGSIMFLIIDGRQAHSIGATLKECQDILYEKGAINAMAMDGGSSATLYMLGSIKNSPSTLSHKDRYLPNAWIIAAKPKQEIHITLDGKKIDSAKTSY